MSDSPQVPHIGPAMHRTISSQYTDDFNPTIDTWEPPTEVEYREASWPAPEPPVRSGAQWGDWYQHAACKGVNTARVFYSESGLVEARELCESCPVLAECRASVFAEESAAVMFNGFRAGLTEEERVAIAKGAGVEVHLCAECGGQFTPHRNSKTCSPDCRRVRHNRFTLEGRKRKEAERRTVEDRRSRDREYANARNAQKLAERDAFLLAHGLTPKQRGVRVTVVCSYCGDRGHFIAECSLLAAAMPCLDLPGTAGDSPRSGSAATRPGANQRRKK